MLGRTPTPELQSPRVRRCLLAGLFLVGFGCAETDSAQVLVHMRTSSAFATFASVRIDVARNGSVVASQVFERSEDDGGDLGSFGLSPAEEENLGEPVDISLVALRDGNEVGRITKTLPRFLSNDRLDAYFCMVDGCLVGGRQVEMCQAEQSTCSPFGCESPELPLHSAPPSYWEGCLIQPPPDDDDTPPVVPSFDALSLGGAADQAITAIQVGGQGEIYVAGTFEQTLTTGRESMTLTSNGLDGFVARFSASGDVEWVAHLTGPSVEVAAGLDLRGERLYVAGTFARELRVERDETLVASFESAGDDTDGYVLRFGLEGEYIDGASFGSDGDDTVVGVALDPFADPRDAPEGAQTIIVAGQLGGAMAFAGSGSSVCRTGVDRDPADPSTSPQASAFVLGLGLDDLGCRWVQTFDGPGDDTLRTVGRAHGGGAIVAGSYDGPRRINGSGGRAFELAHEAGTEGFVAFVDHDGRFTRVLTITGDGRDEVTSVVQDLDGGLLVAGAFAPGDRTLPDRVVASVGMGGTVLALALEPDSHELAWVVSGTTQTGTLSASSAAWLHEGQAGIAGCFSGAVEIGSASISGTDGNDLFFAHISSEGRVVRALGFGAADDDSASVVQRDPSVDRAILAGSFSERLQFDAQVLQVEGGGRDAFISRIVLTSQ